MCSVCMQIVQEGTLGSMQRLCVVTSWGICMMRACSLDRAALESSIMQQFVPGRA